MHTIVLIERYQPSSFFWPKLLKDKKITELSVEEILNKYQGFEGELIAFSSINENESGLKQTIEKCLEMRSSNNYLMLHVLSEAEVMSPSLRKQAFQVGYDVGVCEEEKTAYSSIFNEILFGHLDELITYKHQLNENFLFQNKSLAERYVCLHNELSAQGKDVEDYEAMTIYEIWKHTT